MIDLVVLPQEELFLLQEAISCIDGCGIYADYLEEHSREDAWAWHCVYKNRKEPAERKIYWKTLKPVPERVRWGWFDEKREDPAIHFLDMKHCSVIHNRELFRTMIPEQDRKKTHFIHALYYPTRQDAILKLVDTLILGRSNGQW